MASQSPESDQPTKEGVEALLALIADPDDIAILHRIQQALAIGHRPADADTEVYNDLLEVFGDDMNEDADKVED